MKTEGIRQAEMRDISRIAEILVFTKRVNYRAIFHDDAYSFGVLQVLPLAEAWRDNPEALSRLWVYDDGFVKGLLHVEGREVKELYVDAFFAGTGIGGCLLDFAVEQLGADRLWVLEKNGRALRFYRRHGFFPTGEREPETGTPEYMIALERPTPERAQADGERTYG